jgi:hypothetical protein
MRHLIFLLLALSLLTLACNTKNPVSPIEATNEEAIYNVLFNDYPRLTSLELLTSAIPDTQAFLATPDSSRTLYWHEIETTHDTLVISISDEPVASPVGLVYQAGINYSIRYNGQFHSMRYNSIADSIERFSKPFILNGSRIATCQQWGLPDHVRRGWLLTSISDARFYSGDYHYLNGLQYSTTNHPADTGFIYGSSDPYLIRSANAGDEMDVHFGLIDSTDLLLMYIPQSDYGYQLAVPQPDSASDYGVAFDLPSHKIFSQIRFLVINAGAIGGTYKASGYSYNYRTK